MIFVIGAGIGGLTAAIALRRAGFDVEVFERATELREIGAGLSIWKNALVALDEIGLGDRVRAFAVPTRDAALRTWDGHVLVAPTDSVLLGRLGEFGVVIHRGRLQQVLVEACGLHRIRLGKACESFDETPTGVTVRFADGSSATGDALIGADGLHSKVRAELHGASAPRYSGYTCWRGVVEFDHARLAPGESWGRGARFGHVGMADGQVYWFATETAPPGGRGRDGEKAELRRLFRGWHEPIEALIEATDEAWILRNDISDRPVLRTWARGRVTLVGDAAHPMTPNLGQGACQAIEDAIVLARELTGTPDVPSALRAYEARRIRRTNWIVTTSRRLGAIGQFSNPLAMTIRNAFMKHVASRVQARQLEGLVGYRV